MGRVGVESGEQMEMAGTSGSGREGGGVEGEDGDGREGDDSSDSWAGERMVGRGE